MVELVPGTSLPIQRSYGSPQPEGRGGVQLTEDRQPPSVIDPRAEQPSFSAAELAFVRAAISAYDRRPRKLKTVYDTTAKITDGTTGNLVVPLFTCPAGCEGHVTQCTVDIPNSASINPSAPFANASSWAFLASIPGGGTSGPLNSQADTFRPGMIAFAPAAAAGPIAPGQWTFNDTSSPILYGGDQLLYVLHGGSIAAILSQSVQVTYRIDLYGFEDGQL